MFACVSACSRKQCRSQIDYSFNNEVTSKYANISWLLFIFSTSRASLEQNRCSAFSLVSKTSLSPENEATLVKLLFEIVTLISCFLFFVASKSNQETEKFNLKCTKKHRKNWAMETEDV